MLNREQWQEFARKLDWNYSYASEREIFPELHSGRPWLEREAWAGWEEPFRTGFAEYAAQQSAKNVAVHALHDAIGRLEDYARLPPVWLNVLKLHAATLSLAEFAAVVGNLRAVRFGRDSAWRAAATLGALDEIRHTQIPLLLMHELVRHDPQFDWTHRLYHSNHWVSVAARHMFDELLVTSNPIEFAIGANFVFETGFTNLHFIGMSSLAHSVGDRMFEKMLNSIQSDEARHAQIGEPVLRVVMKKDPAYAQYLVDKWFWRSAQLFAIVTGFSMDYLTPLEHRTLSYKEFVHEWIMEQYLRTLDGLGLSRPWYWQQFGTSLDNYHHMAYASAYTYRAALWFDVAVPSPEERAWLLSKYPTSWPALDRVWSRIIERWRRAHVGNEFSVHGTAIVSFCDLCQLVLCAGTPAHNEASVLTHDGRKYVFCSAPCRWIFEQEPGRYASHKDIVKRVIAGEAPANLVAMLHGYFGLSRGNWGHDVAGGAYPWLIRPQQ